MNRFLIIIACLVWSCGPNGKVCEPSEVSECTCLDGSLSHRTCLSDGDGWGECDCPCERNCTGRTCGDDGCGGICGDCITTEECVDGQCECLYESCLEDCCEEGEVCYGGQCCSPDCTGKECGDDGCGGECPPGCGAGETCNEQNWSCEACVPDCNGKECGTDSCGGECPPGCGAGEICNWNGQCEVCVPDCIDKDCGPDHCGGECPPGCDVSETCNMIGKCVGSIERTWITVTAGTFMMGSPVDEVGRRCCQYDYERQHEVTLTHDFVILSTEALQGDFEDLMGYNPSHWGPDGPGVNCGRDCPVEMVNWNRSAAFCNAISQDEGYDLCYTCTGTGSSVICEPDPVYSTPYDCLGYRLPTEAEWEYAARAGTLGATYNGDLNETQLACFESNPVLEPIAWFCGNSDDRTHPGKLKEPNALGIYDMLGNVQEWCHDWWQFELSDVPVTDPWGLNSGTHRVFRGGSHSALDTSECRSAFRNAAPPHIGGSEQGFRPVRTLP